MCLLIDAKGSRLAAVFGNLTDCGKGDDDDNVDDQYEVPAAEQCPAEHGETDFTAGVRPKENPSQKPASSK
jgi:hypothetical protein